jgi:protein-S-isoprenylcysteine O-methyltransferase Ste14
LSQSARAAASAFAGAHGRGYHRRTPALDAHRVDLLLAVAWIALVGDGVWQTWRAHAARAVLPPVVRRSWQPSVAAGLAVVVSVLAGCLGLERVAGRFPFHVVPAAAGLAMVAGGVVIHGWSRRTLGPIWSGVVQVRAQHPLVDRGPYRFVRHPIYLSGLLLALGTFLAHPSPASLCLGAGLATGVLLKARFEERALRDVLGAGYAAYAARVPAFVPRIGGRDSRLT